METAQHIRRYAERINPEIDDVGLRGRCEQIAEWLEGSHITEGEAKLAFDLTLIRFDARPHFHPVDDIVNVDPPQRVLDLELAEFKARREAGGEC